MKKPNIILRFFSFLFRTVIVLALMVLVAAGSFEGVTWYLTGSFYDLRSVLKDQEKPAAVIKKPTQVEATLNDENVKSTLFFVESEDQSCRYASLILTNTNTGTVELLLMPLHTQVTLGGSLLSDIQKNIPDAGSTLLLDDIARAYGDDKYRIITEVFSQILSMKISGYDVMSQKAFESLLNLTGHVPYHFTNRISYRDNKQVLNYFQTGDQELDGAGGMILISHLDGTDKQESDRLERSNTYLEAWLQKVIQNNKGLDLVDAVEKNAKASEGRTYQEEKEVWNKLTASALTIRILQGAESKGVFSVDSQKAKVQIATLIKLSQEFNVSDEQDSVDSIGDDTETAASSKEYLIELYNAAFHQGLASDWKTCLEQEGYQINRLDNYQEEGPLSTTRIVVSQEGIGQDLLKYFPGADIQVGDMYTGADIRVYLGTDSTDVYVPQGEGSEDLDNKDSEEDETKQNDSKDEDSQEGKKDQEKKEEEDSSDNHSSNESGDYNFATDSE